MIPRLQFIYFQYNLLKDNQFYLQFIILTLFYFFLNILLNIIKKIKIFKQITLRLYYINMQQQQQQQNQNQNQKQQQQNIPAQETEFIWYYVDQHAEEESEKTKGPVSERDLDVLYRTGAINSNTYVFKQGMKNWEQIFKIDCLKEAFIETNNEQNFLLEETQKPISKEEEDEEQAYMKLLDENPEKALEKTVQNLINNKYYKDENQKWRMFDEKEQKWIILDVEPIQEIQKMKEELLESLKKEFGIGQTNKRPQKKDLTGLSEEEIKKIERNRKKSKKQAEKKKQKARDQQQQNYIYVSGLPEDITEEQMVSFFGKAGIIKSDVLTGEKKIKIYKNEEGKCKGDGLVGYQMEESVAIALDMLNNGFITDKDQLTLQRAKFDLNKGTNHDESLKREAPTKLDKLQRLKLKQREQQQSGWEEDDQIVGMQQIIIKNMFTLEASTEEENFFEYLEEDLVMELENIGKISKIKIFEKHPQGVVQIKFVNAVDAAKCIEVMNGRIFDGLKLESFYWDGTTDYEKEAQQLLNQ